MIHKLKLYAYRNMASIVSLVTATAILTVLILQGIMLTAIYNQSRRNEEILQGLSCILLIQPTDRTKDNVRECVNSNGLNEKDFIFQTPEDLKILSDIRDKVTAEITVKNVKGQKGEKGDAGLNGKDGTNGVDGKNGQTQVINKEITLDGKPGEPGQDGREIEFRYNELKQRAEWRYIGDDYWQLFFKACTITNTCNVGIQ